MCQGSPPIDSVTGLTSYFNKVTHPSQIEMLGRITVDILRQERRLTRTSVCLKLIGKLDTTEDPIEVAHLRELLGMLFRK